MTDNTENADHEWVQDTEGAALHSLVLLYDGETQESMLFRSEADRAQYLYEALEKGEYGDEGFAELVQEQDEEAMQADYPEGVSPSLPRPIDRIDGIKEWLECEGFDLYLETLRPTVRSDS